MTSYRETFGKRKIESIFLFPKVSLSVTVNIHKPSIWALEIAKQIRNFDLWQAMDEVDRMKNMARVEVIHPVKGHRFAIQVKPSFQCI